jgi:hypothetical protein
MVKWAAFSPRRRSSRDGVAVSTLDSHCHYLISGQINYTCANLAEHFENLDLTQRQNGSGD